MSTIRVNGVELYYEIHGEGEPVLMIHGLGSSTRDWDLQVPALASRFKVVTYDVRGHARSEKPRQRYSVKLFADDAAALIRALNLGPMHVVGISMGGMIAFQLAVDAPELVRSLVIANSGPAMPIKTLAQRLMIWTRIAIVRFQGMRRMGEVLAARLLPKPETPRRVPNSSNDGQPTIRSPTCRRSKALSTGASWMPCHASTGPSWC